MTRKVRRYAKSDNFAKTYRLKKGRKPSAEYGQSLAEGFRVQQRVLKAVIIRQLIAKYGRSNIGFLWLVVEPIILCSGVLILRSFISGSDENGIPLVAMLWTGYIPLTLWRHISSTGVFLFRRSAGLLFHRDISLVDICVAVVVSELGGCTMAGLLVYFCLYVFNMIPPVSDMGLLLWGWLSMCCVSTGMMSVFAVISELWEPSERFVQPAQYLILPLCGFFFMVDWLPDSIQKVAIWMPTVDCYEMIRAGLLGEAYPTHYMAAYPVSVMLVTLSITLPLFDRARDRIHFG